MNKKLNKLLSLPSTSSAAAGSSSSTNPSSSPWPWPYCYQPRTLSFRHDAVIKTLNSVAYLDDTSDTPSTITTNEEEDEDSEAIVESLISSARVHTRLFFEPGTSNSILLDCSRTTTTTTTTNNNNNNRRPSLKISELKNPTIENENETETEAEAEAEAESIDTNIPVFEEMNSLALAMDSRDPYVDFRKSMEEMVEAHRFKNNSSSNNNNNSTSFEFLQELLCWYLRANEKKNHGYIFGAFVDLLVNIQASSFTSSSTSTTCFCSQSPSSPLSFYNSSSSSCSSSLSTPCVSESDSGGGENSEIDKSRPRSSR